MQAIQNEDEQTRVELRDKIKSKMEVTKFFSGFLSLLLGFAIKDLQITTGSELVFWLSWGGIAFIFSALVFSVAALFAYDRLLMPKRFLDHQNSTYALNSEIHKYMVKAWTSLFIPSIAFLFSGIVLLLSIKLQLIYICTYKIVLAVMILLIAILLPWLLFLQSKIPFSND